MKKPRRPLSPSSATACALIATTALTLCGNTLSFAGVNDAAAEPTSEQVLARLQSLGKMYIASDTKRGLIYTQLLENNPSGEIFVLNQAGEKLGAIYVSSMMIDAPKTFELQLGRDGTLFYLVKGIGKREVGAIIPSAEAPNRWKTVRAEDGLNSLGQLENLRVEADGRVSVEGYDLKNHMQEVAVMDPTITQDGNQVKMQLNVVATVSAASVAEELRKQEIAAADSTTGISGSAASTAKDDNGQTAAGQGVGFTAGWITGLGFMYRQYFENGYGVHVGAVAYGNSSAMHFNAGLEALMTLHQTRISRLYALAGAGVFFAQSTITDYTQPDPTKGGAGPVISGTHNQNSTDLNFGAGIGIEFGVARGIHVAVELPLVVSFNQTDGVSGGYHMTQISPLPSICLIYYIR